MAATTRRSRFALWQRDLPRARQLVDAYGLENASQGMYYYLWESSQLVLLRLRVLDFLSDPRPAAPLLGALSHLVSEAECRDLVVRQEVWAA